MQRPKVITCAAVFFIMWLKSISGFAQVPQDYLKAVPAGLPYIAVVNVKQLVESSIYYAKSQNGRRLIGEIAEDLDSFIQETGVDPVHEMSYLIVSDKLTIAIGQFNTKKIKRYVQGRGNIDELKYGGVMPGAGFF
jgi:hypothetical protein